MIELPECAALSRQLNETVLGLKIVDAAAGSAPHGFAFYTGEPTRYAAALSGRILREARAFGGILEVRMDGLLLLFNDGANLRYHPPGSPAPEKHQLVLRFDNGSALTCTVQMYAGIHLCSEDQYHSVYHQAAREKPSPLGVDFTKDYFMAMASQSGKLSAKAFLATEQRIPGLGNGVLQDILFRARIHPRQKLQSLDAANRDRLYDSVKTTLGDMAASGGRDTERDLFGKGHEFDTKCTR